MEIKNCLKAVFAPFLFGKKNCVSLKLAFAVFLSAYLLCCLCMVISVSNFATSVFDDAVEIIESADNFYMSNAKFYYEGDGFEKKLESIGLTIKVDPKSDPASDIPSGTLFIGHERAAVAIGAFSYSTAYIGITGNPTDIDFTKAYVCESIGSVRAIIPNLILSTSLLFIVLGGIVLLLLALIISLITKLLAWFLNVELDFKQRMFIALSSFVYPFIIVAIVGALPNSLLIILSFWDVILRLSGAIILFYIFAVLIPQKKLTGK